VGLKHLVVITKVCADQVLMVRFISREICVIFKNGHKDFKERCKDPTIRQHGINLALTEIQDMYCTHFHLVWLANEFSMYCYLDPEIWHGCERNNLYDR